jgi:hypothetical protein
VAISSRFRNAFAILTISVLSLCSLAQDAQPTTPQSGTQAPDSKDQKNKKKDKKSDDTLDTSVFSDRVANNVMNDIRDGLEGHSQRLFLSAFDGDKMDGYLRFEDQIQAYMEKYDSFRVHIRIIQTTVEQSRGVVLAQFEMEAMPRSGGPVYRNSSQLRFELEKGKKGWKVVDLRPRLFFS